MTAENWLLQVDDEIRQKGSTKDMIFKLPFLISHISSFFTLFEGDVILTGTSSATLILCYTLDYETEQCLE